MKTSLHSTLRGAAFVLAASLGASLAAQPSDSTTQPSTYPNNTTQPAVSAPMSTDTNSSTMPDTSKLKHHDKVFLDKAAKGGMKEVAVSQAVMANLSNQQVKDFATMMVNDHTAANNELMSLAASKGLTLPAADPKLAEKWSDKTGNVDKKYIHEMVEDHEDTVKLFKKATESGDADIRAFAVKTLPTLQHHLDMAKDLKKTLSM